MSPLTSTEQKAGAERDEGLGNAITLAIDREREERAVSLPTSTEQKAGAEVDEGPAKAIARAVNHVSDAVRQGFKVLTLQDAPPKAPTSDRPRHWGTPWVWVGGDDEARDRNIFLPPRRPRCLRRSRAGCLMCGAWNGATAQEAATARKQAVGTPAKKQVLQAEPTPPEPPPRTYRSPGSLQNSQC